MAAPKVVRQIGTLGGGNHFLEAWFLLLLNVFFVYLKRNLQDLLMTFRP